MGSVLLSVLHALIPNYWAPVLAVARSEQWSLRETAAVTLVAGLAHVLSTVLLGALLGLLGYRLALLYTSFCSYIAPRNWGHYNS